MGQIKKSDNSCILYSLCQTVSFEMKDFKLLLIKTFTYNNEKIMQFFLRL